MYRLSNRLSACLALAAVAISQLSLARPSNKDLDFEDFYELEPIQIVGQEIPITVFARSGGDRSYATRFAHKVIEVAYDTLEKSPGPGLVIMGKSGEPHPIKLLENFMAKAKREEAPAELRQIADELEKSIGEWREKINFDMENDDDGEELPVDINQLIDAFPMPMPPMAAQLYLVAWELDFDPERFDLRLAEITADELRQQDFDEFRWVFYLPPKNTLNKVLKEVLPLAFEAGDLGPVKRMLARAAIATFKPLIKDAVEGVRKGVLYWSVLSANEAAFNEGDIELLAGKYMESQMPRGKILGSDKTERGIEATRIQKAENKDYARDPFVVLEPVEAFDPETFTPFFGRYGDDGHRNKRFFAKDGAYFWQEGDDEPIEYLPAGDLFFVSTQKDVTLQFFPGETPSYSQVELRKGRFRHTFDRLFEED
ncbi:hypothetical protein [Pelagicoccus sp. SDUM812002]|uniref:hypothetical protein n=1 Tax=Pelagicoccus sp. SDUM812002 TaxID=3041266 RepID=UPI00280CDFDD|nr:hypothetical protein [Pelagicoccus sp. SDUM812002]MDQ8188332.1 hypothetical protein [Pelagicoccus sp. SDUM812002]